MQKGICPNCEIPMKIDGKLTHNFNQNQRCEIQFRNKIGIHHRDITFEKDGKIYVVDAHYEERKKQV